MLFVFILSVYLLLQECQGILEMLSKIGTNSFSGLAISLLQL